MSRTKKAFLVAGILVLCIFGVRGFLYLAEHNRTLADFLVSYHLKYSCSGGKSGCDELRPLPQILQGKKIVFNQNTNVKFNPYEEYPSFAELDTEGFLDTDSFEFIPDRMVDPKLGEHGYLAEREYKIVRAVYHCNCSYCVDSSDYQYIVLEDSRDNRFTSLLSDLDFSTNPAQDIPWDKQLPYVLGKNGELGQLVNIN